jgi:hypothetical protein
VVYFQVSSSGRRLEKGLELETRILAGPLIPKERGPILGVLVDAPNSLAVLRATWWWIAASGHAHVLVKNEELLRHP